MIILMIIKVICIEIPVELFELLIFEIIAKSFNFKTKKIFWSTLKTLTSL